MSATSIAPHTSSPSARAWPVFSNWNVTVRSAFTQGSKAAPVSPFSPEGMSTATTFAPWSRSAFMRRIRSAAGPWGPRDRPVPYRASTQMSGAGTSASQESSGMPMARARSRLAMASGVFAGAAGNRAHLPPAFAYKRAQA